MSHTEDVYDHPIEHHDPKEGFDPSEPAVGAIFAFTAGSVILLVLVIVALQGYFDQVYNQAVSDKILTAPSEQLQSVRNRDAWNATHYMYGDLKKESGRIRIPVEQAMAKFAEEAATGKLFYPAKPTPVKKEEGDQSAAPAAADKKK
jgi:stringent starvation protein B